MNVAHGLERSARLFADRPALICKAETWTYAELDAAVSRLAGGLADELGIVSGERVLLLLPNSAAFVLSYAALQKLGAVPISLNVMFRAAEIGYIARDARAVAILVGTELVGSLPPRDAMPSVREVVQVGGGGMLERLARTGRPRRAIDLDRDQVAAILYTSGTTGKPKGAMLSHGNVVSNVYATNHHLHMQPEDRLLCVLPLFHVFGQNFIMNASINCGSALYVHERFNLDQAIESIKRDAISIFYGVPTIFVYLLGDQRVQRASLSSLRLSFSAAASMPQDVSERWRERLGLPIVEGYGLTECSPFATYNHEYAYRPGSVGTPIENVEVKIFDTDGREVATGELGEICIKGPNVMLGYFGKPEDTREAIRDGWLRSGDIGRIDEDGYVYVVDRVKDMVNVGGFKVWPREVEEVLFTHPGVKEAAVIGVPDPVYGEVVKACIVRREGAVVAAEELIELCRSTIAVYKVPREVAFVEQLPKSPTGKVLKRELRAVGSQLEQAPVEQP